MTVKLPDGFTMTDDGVLEGMDKNGEVWSVAMRTDLADDQETVDLAVRYMQRSMGDENLSEPPRHYLGNSPRNE